MGNSVRAFYEKLSGTSKDVFAALAADLQSSSRTDKLTRLQAFLATLKQEIDEINARRQALGNMLDNVRAVRAAVDQSLAAQRGRPDLELSLFHDALIALESDLDDEILEMRPRSKLEKKYNVARKIKKLQTWQRLARMLQEDVLGKEPNPPVNGADLAAKHAEMVTRNRVESTPEIERRVAAVMKGEADGFPTASEAAPPAEEDDAQ